ncbi:MAG TPA: helix-turn-helix transcriptional regulator [Streptosporangiaceae bacterium]|nr:helix-turn-helix transcriptional regulator [Streptosporangiaceae bacterium]
MPIDDQHVKQIVDRVFAGQEAMKACRERQLGLLISMLGKYGLTQGVIASRTGIPQGRLSEYSTGKRLPMAASIFEAAWAYLPMRGGHSG